MSILMSREVSAQLLNCGDAEWVTMASAMLCGRKGFTAVYMLRGGI